MRARYTAFATGAIDFLIESHHSSTRDTVDRQELENWSSNSEWLGLLVLDSEGGPGEDEGVVRFVASYKDGDALYEHKEKALFRREDGVWKFLDAEPLKSEPVRRDEPKIGRNEPCHCGSGKKYKRCHGAAA